MFRILLTDPHFYLLTFYKGSSGLVEAYELAGYSGSVIMQIDYESILTVSGAFRWTSLRVKIRDFWNIS